MTTTGKRPLRRIVMAAGSPWRQPGTAHAAGVDVNRDLAGVRAITADLHDEASAIAAGHLPTDACVASPDG